MIYKEWNKCISIGFLYYQNRTSVILRRIMNPAKRLIPADEAVVLGSLVPLCYIRNHLIIHCVAVYIYVLHVIGCQRNIGSHIIRVLLQRLRLVAIGIHSPQKILKLHGLVLLKRRWLHLLFIHKFTVCIICSQGSPVVITSEIQILIIMIFKRGKHIYRNHVLIQAVMNILDCLFLVTAPQFLLKIIIQVYSAADRHNHIINLYIFPNLVSKCIQRINIFVYHILVKGKEAERGILRYIDCSKLLLDLTDLPLFFPIL